MSRSKSILFLCSGNSCRSQMAEGFCRSLHGEIIKSLSAGIEKHGLNPLAVQVMAESGIDISGHRSKTTSDLGDSEFDYVVTVCDNASETCPYFPAGTRVIHRSFEDPPELAAEASSDEERLPHYRRVRDEIREFVFALPDILKIEK